MGSVKIVHEPIYTRSMQAEGGSRIQSPCPAPQIVELWDFQPGT